MYENNCYIVSQSREYVGFALSILTIHVTSCTSWDIRPTSGSYFGTLTIHAVDLFYTIVIDYCMKQKAGHTDACLFFFICVKLFPTGLHGSVRVPPSDGVPPSDTFKIFSCFEGKHLF